MCKLVTLFLSKNKAWFSKKNCNTYIYLYLWNYDVTALDMHSSVWHKGGSPSESTTNGRTFSMNPKVGVQISPGMRHFLHTKSSLFLKIIRLSIKNECSCVCPVIAFQMLPLQMNTLYIYITATSIEQYKVESIWSCLAQIVELLAWGWGSSASGSGVNLFLSQNNGLFLEDIHLTVKNYCCCPLTDSSSDDNFTN